MSKEFTVSTTCPQCGLTHTSTHDEESMRKNFSNSSTVTVLCTACQADFEQPLACAEWDDYCKEIPLPADV